MNQETVTKEDVETVYFGGGWENTRRVKAVLVNKRLIASLFESDRWTRLSVEGLPDDAEMVNFIFDPGSNGFFALFEHDSFDEVKEGYLTPSAYLQIAQQRIKWEGDT